MQIIITSQGDYNKVVKNKLHIGNELVLQNTSDFILVHTDVTVGKNGKCKTADMSTVNITAKKNGMVTAGGKTSVTGHDDANIIAKGNCKVTLHDSAFGNCSDHCHITVKGQSKVLADGHCSVYAFDESEVSAFGSSKVYTNQAATAKGSDVTFLSGKDASTLIGRQNCTITAKDSCIVYASDNCSVKASDNVLIVANKPAKVVTQDNCLIMSNDNPNIIAKDECEHINVNDVNDRNIMSTLKQMAQSKAVAHRPYVAIQILKDNIPGPRKEAVSRRLNTMGLKDQISIKNYFYSQIEATPELMGKTPAFGRQLEAARKTGYVQGVCECVNALGDEKSLGKKLLSEMNVTKEMAKKYASPQVYKAMQQGIYAQNTEQKLEKTHGRSL